MRTFVAIELGEGLRQSVAEEVERIRAALSAHSIRWAAPDTVHLTLRFLGETDSSQIGEISETLDELSGIHPRMRLEVKGLGCFPSPAKPRVLWFGVTELDGQLESLQAAVERAAQGWGYPPEGRRFHPHLTVGRVRKETNRSALAADLTGIETGGVGLLHANSVSLIESELHPSGARHTTLHSADLAPQ